MRRSLPSGTAACRSSARSQPRSASAAAACCGASRGSYTAFTDSKGCLRVRRCTGNAAIAYSERSRQHVVSPPRTRAATVCTDQSVEKSRLPLTSSEIVNHTAHMIGQKADMKEWFGYTYSFLTTGAHAHSTHTYMISVASRAQIQTSMQQEARVLALSLRVLELRPDVKVPRVTHPIMPQRPVAHDTASLSNPRPPPPRPPPARPPADPPACAH